MVDISACNGVVEKKGKKDIAKVCILRHECRRFTTHLNSTSAYQSYIKAQINNGTCEMKL